MKKLSPLAQHFQSELQLKYAALKDELGFTDGIESWCEEIDADVAKHGWGHDDDFDNPLHDWEFIVKTRDLARQRLDQLADVYFRLWNDTRELSEVFVETLSLIESTVRKEMRKIWRKQPEWFERVCRSRVRDELRAAVVEWRNNARRAELKRSQALNPPPSPAAVRSSPTARETPPVPAAPSAQKTPAPASSSTEGFQERQLARKKKVWDAMQAAEERSAPLSGRQIAQAFYDTRHPTDKQIDNARHRMDYYRLYQLQ